MVLCTGVLYLFLLKESECVIMKTMTSSEALQFLINTAKKRDNFVSNVSDNITDYLPELDDDFFEVVPFDDDVLLKVSYKQILALYSELKYEYVNATKYNAQYDLVRVNDSSFDVCFFPPIEPIERILLKRNICSEILKNYHFAEDDIVSEDNDAVLQRKIEICDELCKLLDDYSDFNRDPEKNAVVAKDVNTLRAELVDINSKSFLIQQRNERKIILSHLLQKVCENVFLRSEHEAEMCEYFENDASCAEAVAIVKTALDDDNEYQKRLSEMHMQLDSLRDYLIY